MAELLSFTTGRWLDSYYNGTAWELPIVGAYFAGPPSPRIMEYRATSFPVTPGDTITAAGSYTISVNPSADNSNGLWIHVWDSANSVSLSSTKIYTVGDAIPKTGTFALDVVLPAPGGSSPVYSIKVTNSATGAPEFFDRVQGYDNYGSLLITPILLLPPLEPTKPMSKPWWMCAPKALPITCDPRGSGEFVSFVDYDPDHRFPTKSSRVPSAPIRVGDCDTCSPNLIVIPAPEVPIEPPSTITLYYSDPEGFTAQSPYIKAPFPLGALATGKVFIGYLDPEYGPDERIVLELQGDVWVEATYGMVQALIVATEPLGVWFNWEIVSGVGYRPLGAAESLDIVWELIPYV